MSENESKHEKFVRLAENRVNGILKNIELLKNLKNKNSYDYSDDELKQITKSIKDATKELELVYFSGERQNFKIRN